MKAIIQDRYGSPRHLWLAEVEVPALDEDRALIRVRAASVNSQDWRRVRGEPVLIRAAEGWRRPRNRLLGTDAAGVVEAIGPNVDGLQVGDEVMGFRAGAFGEYVAGKTFVPKPANLTFEQAATLPVAGGTALIAVRDKGRLQAGERVAINGAGGGVGTFAVQIARALGGEVTAITGTAQLDLVESLGADHLIDYVRTDFIEAPDRYDLIVDISARPSLGRQLRALAPGGRLVRVGARPGHFRPLADLAGAIVRSRLLKQPVVTFLADVTKDHLLTLKELAESGRLVPVIDRTYPLSAVPAAIAYASRQRTRGKIVITLP
jgi:NADPH:quinone reductase-like Zn-dependent oxidoreductase